MNIDKFILPTVLLFALVSAYWYLVFELNDHLLLRPRLTKSLRIPIGIFSALTIFVLSAIIGGTLAPYLLIIVILFAELKIFYDDTPLRSAFCACTCLIHILSIRSITTGAFALLCGYSVYNISTDATLYAYSALATFTLLNIAVVLIIKLIPLDQLRIVNEHPDQQRFMVAWMLSNIIYLLFNSSTAESPVYHKGVIINQIIAPLAILFGTYIMLLFAIKTGKLLSYKEKNAKLRRAVTKEQEYRNAITKDALLSYEFNLNKDSILSGFEASAPELGDMIYHYSDMLGYMARQFIYPDDIEAFANTASPSNIIKEFEQGKSEITAEYRRLTSSNEYIWCRAVTNLAKDAENGDIHGFTYVKDIDADKRRQMELQYKAERDSLTGLYNKGVTTKLITEHLLFNHSHILSALFMVDVDDFKHINDCFGHAYGDKALCELSSKLLHIFRSDDIVGRIGGDEFIIYMKNNATDIAIRDKGAEICKAFRMSYGSANAVNAHTLSGSVGVAVSPKDGITFDELYRHADTALYSAKRDGKGNCQIYDGSAFSGYQSTKI